MQLHYFTQQMKYVSISENCVYATVEVIKLGGERSLKFEWASLHAMKVLDSLVQGSSQDVLPIGRKLYK